jgi:hypothetical protein
MASSFRTKVGYNSAKLRVLQALAHAPDQWWTVEDWAREAQIAPTRRMYTYALRLVKYDLVIRGSIRGRLLYRIAPQGSKRLAWLKR